MSTMADKFEELGVIPVVVLNDVKDALPLAKALYEGGLPCAEVTFRTAAAEESIRVMHEAYPDMVLAAGTVLTTEQVDRAVAAGASLIVSPGFDPEIVDYCISKNIEVVPGIVTPSELAQAVKRGLTRVKFFPAEAAGGLKMIKAMCAAYTNVRIMPTGGINAKNISEYLECDKIFCCGGSWMVKGDIGLCLYILFAVFMLFKVLAITWRYRNNKMLTLLGGTTVGAFAACFFCMGFDNVITYAQQGYVLPFMLFGIFLKTIDLTENGEFEEEIIP